MVININVSLYRCVSYISNSSTYYLPSDILWHKRERMTNYLWQYVRTVTHPQCVYNRLMIRSC